MRKVGNVWILLAIVGLLSTLWNLYPRFLVGGLIPLGESTGIGKLLYQASNNGILVNTDFVPPLEFYIAYYASRITGITPLQVAYYINPIIMGLCVLAFYYFISKILDKKQSMSATVLFAFNEAIFYRASSFVSTEILGILFMFVFLGLYREKRYLPSLLVLFLVSISHLLPFFMCVGLVVFIWVFERMNPKRLIIGGSVGLLIFTAMMIVFAQLRNWLYRALMGFSIGNLFLYNPIEILLYARNFMGCIVIAIIVAYNYKKMDRQMTNWFFVTGLMFVVSYLTYSNYVIGPTRIIPYIAIGLVCTVGNFVKSTKLVALILCLSIASPLVGGSDTISWLSDSLTRDEVKALDWAGSQHLFAKVGDYHQSPVNYWRIDTPQQDYISLFYNNTVLLNITPKYVIVSPRMEKGEFTLEIPTSGRAIEVRQPLVDIWRNDPTWKIIYNQTGVRIYEKIGWVYPI